MRAVYKIMKFEKSRVNGAAQAAARNHALITRKRFLTLAKKRNRYINNQWQKKDASGICASVIMAEQILTQEVLRSVLLFI